MKRAVSLLISPRLPAAVLAVFFLIYCVAAFGAEEPLLVLMKLTRENLPLLLVLALLPLNAALRLLSGLRSMGSRLRVMRGGGRGEIPGGIFAEEVTIGAGADLGLVKERLAGEGFAVRGDASSLAAWRGVPFIPLHRLGALLIFSGILLSLAWRQSIKLPAIEGEPLAWPAGGGALVEKIGLQESDGAILSRTLAIHLRDAGGGRTVCGIYPPARYAGAYVYPRYLGIAPFLRFKAPGMEREMESYFLISIYPPGKEDFAVIPGTPYRIGLSIAPPLPEEDPFISGRMELAVRILKGDELLQAGTVPLGGRLAGKGSELSFLGLRRYVATDLVMDHGFLPVWGGVACYLLAVFICLPLRIFLPRVEMILVSRDGMTHTAFRSEEFGTKRGGLYHELLDSIEKGRSDH